MLWKKSQYLRGYSCLCHRSFGVNNFTGWWKPFVRPYINFPFTHQHSPFPCQKCQLSLANFLKRIFKLTNNILQIDLFSLKLSTSQTFTGCFLLLYIFLISEKIHFILVIIGLTCGIVHDTSSTSLIIFTIKSEEWKR